MTKIRVSCSVTSGQSVACLTVSILAEQRRQRASEFGEISDRTYESQRHSASGLNLLSQRFFY
jgi:hypothetical protein